MCSTLRGQKMTLDPWELAFQMVVSCHVGAGNGTQVLWKCSQILAAEPSLQPHYWCKVPRGLSE